MKDQAISNRVPAPALLSTCTPNTARIVGLGLVIAAMSAACAADEARRASALGLGDDDTIRDIDRDVELRTAIVDLPGVGEAEILYAVRGENAIWTGDILLGKADEIDQGFRGASLTSSLWPNKTLKYRFGPGLAAAAKTAAQSAMTGWEAKTSIRFVEAKASDTGGFLTVTSVDDGCYANLGYPGSGSTFELNLGPGCQFEATALHEFGHALGLFHEQTRADRDSHVDIDWGNVQDGMASQFDKYTKSGDPGKDRGAYDYNSIMHYPSDAFAKDPAKPTMTKTGGGLIAETTSLSAGDVAAVEAMYANGGGKEDDADNGGDGAVVDGSCENRCASSDPVDAGAGNSCYCDAGCVEYGDCCSDRPMHCGDGGDNGNGDDNGNDGDQGAPSCSGRCGSAEAQSGADNVECYCDELCTDNKDCCSDHAATCGGGDNGDGDNGDGDGDGDGGNGAGSCAGNCGGEGSAGTSCYCDAQCVETGDCCSDYAASCDGNGDGGGDNDGGDNGGGGGNNPSCVGKCGMSDDQGGCFCEDTCLEFEDCCQDFAAVCL